EQIVRAMKLERPKIRLSGKLHSCNPRCGIKKIDIPVRCLFRTLNTQRLSVANCCPTRAAKKCSKPMKKNSASQSAFFHPRIFASFILCSAGAWFALFSFAATPPGGTLSDTSGPITYTAGPFFQANQSPVFELDSGPRCDQQGFPCDTYKLTLKVPS